MDDEVLSCELLKNLITQFQLPIEVVGFAHDGDKAVELISSLHPDIVFLDIEMPSCNGIQVMERINKTYSGIIKFIIITAYSYFEYAQSSLRLGAKDILLKPIDSRQFLEMINRVLDYRHSGNQMFDEILEYVNSQFDQDITLTGCAGLFHISPNYMTRMFKKYAGMNFIAYLNELRIKKAVELLKETDLPIKEIAQKTGYNNLNYFYKNFSKITGVTPRMYKDENR